MEGMVTQTRLPVRPATAGRGDLLRQVAVLVSAVLALLGAFIGSGAAGGTPVAQAAGGALSATATLVAPAGPAFGIWSVIYLGLVALALWQAVPARRADPRQRATGWWVAASLLLNAGWLLVVQAGSLIGSVVVVVALLAVLVLVMNRLVLGPGPRTRPEAVLLDGTTGLYLGWVSIATVADLAATVSQLVSADLWPGATFWAVLVLVVAAGVGVGVALAWGGRLSYSAGLAWGLAWVAVGRLEGPTSSTVTAVVAGLAAFTVLAAAVVVRTRRTAAHR